MSTWTCANKVRSRKRANTPAFGDAMRAERSTMPVSPSTNRTNRRSSGNTVTSRTHHGAVGRTAGATEVARSSWVAASASIGSSFHQFDTMCLRPLKHESKRATRQTALEDVQGPDVEQGLV